MSDENFKKALEFTFDNEGGLSNRKNDRGGLTNYGITFETFLRYKKDGTEEELMNLTVEEAEKIYEELFWKALCLDQLFSSVKAVLIFDQAVNRGLVPAVKDVQDVLGVTSDGILGKESFKALDITDDINFCRDFVFECQRSYIRVVDRHPEQLENLKGWMNRTLKMWAYVSKEL